MKIADLFQVYQEPNNYRKMYHVLDDCGENTNERIRFDVLSGEILIYSEDMVTDLSNIFTTADMLGIKIREIKKREMTLIEIERELGYPIQLK